MQQFSDNRQPALTWIKAQPDQPLHSATTDTQSAMEQQMTGFEMFYLVVVIAGAACFAGVLSYNDWQQRHSSR